MKKRMWAAMLVIAISWPLGAQAQGNEASFEQLWAYATKHSPQLQVVQSQRARADAARAQARGVLAGNPILTLEGGPRFQGVGRSYDLAARVSQPVRVAGEPRAERRLVQKATQRIEADILEAEWALRQELRALYRKAATERSRAELTTLVLAFAERVLALVTKQVSAGEASPLKLRLVEIEVLQAKQEAIAATQSSRESRLELAHLVGMPASDPPIASSSLELAELPSAEELAREAKARAPNLNTLRARLAESQAYSEVTERRRFVQPELGAAYVREGSTPVAGPVSHSVLATLSVPMPFWFRNQGERAQARAEAAVVSTTLDAQERLIAVEVARLRSRVDAEEQRLTLYAKELLPRVAEHLALIEKALAMGEMDIFDVTTFRARTLEAQRAALETRAAYARALTELERFIGYELPARTTEGAAP